VHPTRRRSAIEETSSVEALLMGKMVARQRGIDQRPGECVRCRRRILGVAT
jgi:hypothetical protein